MRVDTGQSLLEKVESLQNMLVSFATGGEADNEQYVSTRRELIKHPFTKDRVPDFVRTCRDLNHFWEFIKHEYAHYQGRRFFLWGAFAPLLNALEEATSVPSDLSVERTLSTLDANHVEQVWHRALERRERDPEGAITLARTLLETVCKHILDDFGAPYSPNADLPKLYYLAAEQLRLAPSQHSEEAFKAILGSCQAVVNNLATLRNRLGDAHGQGKRPVRPLPRHAELAVNLAGAMAIFLVSTSAARQKAQGTVINT